MKRFSFYIEYEIEAWVFKMAEFFGISSSKLVSKMLVKLWNEI
jgi:hypothetical protein